jgi:HK97 family phage portal protein
MKIFGIEIRAVGKQKKSVPMVGDAWVGNTSILGGYLRYGATDRNWRAEAGQLETNSTVAIGISKIAQKISQAKLCVKTDNPDGSVTYTHDKNLFAWQMPLPQIDETVLLKTIACSLKIYGNAYLLKRRSQTGFLIGLAPLMVWQVTPKSDVHIDGTPNNGNELITRYQVTPYGGGAMFYVAPSEIVHFRDGMVDPNNPALGLSALLACLRQIVSDNEASNYCATLMSNMGIPGVIVSPKESNVIEPTQEQRKSMRERWQSFTRDRRGQMMDLPGAFDIKSVALSPTDMKAIESKVHTMTEILGALGVDPMILGLPSDSKTYNNMAEAREAFIEDTILPLLSLIASTLNVMFIQENSLPLKDNQRLAFDSSCYRELDEDVTAKYDRAEKAFKAGASTRGEFRKSLGFQDNLDDPRTWFDMNALASPVATSTRKQRYTQQQFAIAEDIQLLMN